MPSLDFRRDVVPFLVATLGEFFALILWLHLKDQGESGLASLALWTGFAIERLAVATWVQKVYAAESGINAAPLWATGVFLIVITVAEVTIWNVWLKLARGSGSQFVGPTAAVLTLLVLIHALHSLEMGAVRKQNPVIFAVSPRTLFFSIMEAAGAATWLALATHGLPVFGALAMLTGLTIEHIVQGGLLKPQPS